MAVRSRDFVGIAEGIRSHELSAKSQIENLKGRISELSSRRNSLNDTISYLEAAIAAAYEDTDEDGYPDYGLIASLEARKSSAENELSGVEQELDSTGGELKNKQNELEIVEEEKAQTLFEIQERARKTSDNISLAGGMYGAYAGVGGALQNSLRTSFSSLSQAAGILGGSVVGGSSGSSGGSALGIGNTSSGETGTNGGGGNTETGALAAFARGYSGEALPLSASQFSTNQDQLATPASLPNYHSGQNSLNTKALQSFSSEQSANEYALSSFREVNTSQAISRNADEYKSSQHSFADWLNPDNYTKEGHYIGAGQSWGYKPYGNDSGEYESTIMTPAQQALDSYMQSHNYGKEDFATYSKDAEWQKLHKVAYPDSGVLDSLKGSVLARQQLADYMNAHNYGHGDFAIFSRDAEWQRLHQMAYPGFYENVNVTSLNLEQKGNLDIQEVPNKSSILDTKNAFEFADRMYDRKSIHWQEAANRHLDNLIGEMNNIKTSMREAKSKANQKRAERDNYINSNGLDRDTAARDSYYQDLVREYNEANEKYNSLLNRCNNYMIAVDDISRSIIPEMRTTYYGMNGSDFNSSYNDFITEPQGYSVQGFGGVCGIVETCNIVNQQTGSNLDEADGIKEYVLKGLCVTDSSYKHNGGTNPKGRKQFLESKGLTYERLEGSVLGKGFTLDEVANRFRNGESAALILKAQDLLQPELSNRSKAVELMDAIKNMRGVSDPTRANHATTIAGFSYDPNGHVTGVWINDTGGGPTGNRVFIDYLKFKQMQRQTIGFSVELSKRR